MGPWCALWHISAYGCLLHSRSAGIPVAWMLSSNGTEATIQYFLNFVKMRSLEITPRITMSDHDQVQMNAIKAMYPGTTLLLCWWHMLHTMRMQKNSRSFGNMSKNGSKHLINRGLILCGIGFRPIPRSPKAL